MKKQDNNITRRDFIKTSSAGLAGAAILASPLGPLAGKALAATPPNLAVEKGTRVISSFLDVRRIGGTAQDDTHLLGHRGEEMLKDLKANGIDRFASAGTMRRHASPGPC